MVFSITQNGKELGKRRYTWDEETKTLSTTEDNLVLDFSNYDAITFITGSECTFDTGSECCIHKVKKEEDRNFLKNLVRASLEQTPLLYYKKEK